MECNSPCEPVLSWIEVVPSGGTEWSVRNTDTLIQRLLNSGVGPKKATIQLEEGRIPDSGVRWLGPTDTLRRYLGSRDMKMEEPLPVVGHGCNCRAKMDSTQRGLHLA